MEPMQCEETARISILALLKRRELFMPNAENLTLEELQQIYDTFLEPKPRRERRQRFDTAAVKGDDKKLPKEMENLTERIKVVYVVGEKQKRSANYNELQIHSSQPKRSRCSGHKDDSM